MVDRGWMEPSAIDKTTQNCLWMKGEMLYVGMA